MKTQLNISGMHCASCAANIEHCLKKKPGVALANVNFAIEKLNLEYDPEKISLEEIKREADKIGYKLAEAMPATDHAGHDMSSHEHDHAAESIKILRNRFLGTLIFGLPLLYIVMGKMVGLTVPQFIKNNLLIVELILASGAILTAFNIWLFGLKGLIRLRPGMDSLIFIGTAAAYFYSLTVSIIYWLKPGETMPGLYYESAAFILIFIALGKYLEAATKGKTGEAIKKLMGLQPKTATVIKNGVEMKISISEVKVGDIILIKPGEKIPVDGVVIEGYSSVDEKMISGESLPIEKNAGNDVIGATINKNGRLIIKTLKVGNDTMIAQIIKIVNEAFAAKAPIQLLADKISFYFVPAVIGLAILTFSVWTILGYPFTFALTAFVSVLIIACPCALGLATPTAVMMGTGLAAARGILIKNGKALEVAKKITMVIFDKTGTLTKGEPEVTDIIQSADKTKDEILRLAASVEKNSEHPLADAIVKEAGRKKLKLAPVKNFIAMPGEGVRAVVNGQNIILGTRKLMVKNQIDTLAIENKMSELEKQGKTTMILVIDKSIIGLISLADTLKDNSREAVNKLKAMGKQVAMISGDNKRVADAIAKELSIEFAIAEVMPQDKASIVKKLQRGGEIGNWPLEIGHSRQERVVAMVGDGINDAPALAQADLGIALGSGTDVAMETGEIVLIKDDLRDVAAAINLSSFTLKKIKQNLFWAFFYNIIGIPVAAGILYPLTGWLLNPGVAAAAMAFSSVSVVLNALSMKNYKA
ncbi:copper-translocating P-type ATPase [Candidatus Falkowbacteria bacterium]|nr:copper-translocating P-type ATPase [Candidatus Falkowbacteria bacterium]